MTDTYLHIDAEPEGNNWFEVLYGEVMDNRHDFWYYGDGNWLVVERKKIDMLTYSIYENGKIEKYIPKRIKKENLNKYQYFFYDHNNNEHNLGVFNYYTIKNRYGALYGSRTVDLIDVNQIENYSNSDGSIKFGFTINSLRIYVNDKTLASMFGAMLCCGFEDIVYNGFSHADGGSKPSTSHKNGYNGDFRYLRLDQLGGRTKLFNDNTSIGWKGLDEVRQNKFNDELYKFGWKSMLSQEYGDAGSKRLLNHCKDDPHKHHDDHLHIQSYKPNYKEIVE